MCGLKRKEGEKKEREGKRERERSMQQGPPSPPSSASLRRWDEFSQNPTRHQEHGRRGGTPPSLPPPLRPHRGTHSVPLASLPGRAWPGTHEHRSTRKGGREREREEKGKVRRRRRRGSVTLVQVSAPLRPGRSEEQGRRRERAQAQKRHPPPPPPPPARASREQKKRVLLHLHHPKRYIKCGKIGCVKNETNCVLANGFSLSLSLPSFLACNALCSCLMWRRKGVGGSGGKEASWLLLLLLRNFLPTSLPPCMFAPPGENRKISPKRTRNT